MENLTLARLRLNLVVAVCKSNNGIGINNDLPWKIRGDMDFFKKVTSETSKPGLKNAVLMGRKTWDSIPQKNRPLRNRYNVVLSRTLEKPATEDLQYLKSFGNALNELAKKADLDQVHIIGGSGVFQEALDHESCHRIYLTEVMKDFECDVFFPHFDVNQFVELRLPWIDSSLRSEGDVDYRIRCLQKIRPQLNMSTATEATHAYLVAAMDLKRGIGSNRILPWPTLSKDFNHYTGLVRGTEGHPNVAVIGRTSWESMTPEEKNLPYVLYVVISKTKSVQDYPECCCVVKNFQEAILVASELVRDEKANGICFLGGHDIYKEAIESKFCGRLYLTRVLSEFPSDVFFPAFEHLYELDSNTVQGEDRKVTLEEAGVQFRFEEYKLKE